MAATATRTAPAASDVKHAAASYQTASPRRTKAFCGAPTGPIAVAWNYVTCADCKNA
jgi:hypothetical protein